MALNVVQSWGIGNFRQTAGFPRSRDRKYQYVCPLGPSIVVWDIKTRKQIESTQLHSDLIVCLLKSDANKLVLSLSYSGEARILTEDLECINKFDIPAGNIFYASWSEDGNNFCVCTLGPKSVILIYEISNDGVSCKLVWLKYASTYSSTVTQATACTERGQGCNALNSNVSMEIPNSSPIGSKTEIGVSHNENSICRRYYGCVFTDTNTIFCIYKQSKMPCEAHLLSNTGMILIRKSLSPFDDMAASMLCISSCRKNRLAVGLQRGIFVFVDCSSLEITATFLTQGSAQVCLWDSEKLLTASYQSGILQWWSTTGELLRELSITPIDSIIHLNWAVPEKELWIGGIPSLNYISLDIESDSSESCETGNGMKGTSRTQLSLVEHQLAGCGLNYKKNNLIASGDLAGNVIINLNSSEMDLSKPDIKTNVKSSVRCLCWLENTVLIGTLNGELFSWVPGQTEHKLVHSFASSVLTIRNSNHQGTVFAVGTGCGDVFVFDFDGTEYVMKLEKQVHEPLSVGLETEKRPMEIWSVSWDPTDRFLATASEDKTTVVVAAKDGNCLFLKVS